LIKSLAIIELYQHDEVLRHYCEMLEGSDYNIKIFCSKVVHDCLKESINPAQFSWIIKTEEESITTFLSEKEATIKENSLVFVTTALSDFKAFYKLSRTTKMTLLIHNVHSFLAPEASLSFQHPIADRLRLLKLYRSRAHFYKKQLLKSVFGLGFPNEQILNYVEEHYTFPEQLKLMSLPFAYARSTEPISSDLISVVIPCTVSEDLRDYQLVAHAFAQIEQNLKEKIQLVLLGQVKEDAHPIVNDFRKLSKEKIELLTFDHFIPAAEYERHLLKADFLILPFKKIGRNHIYRERLGYSKISGGINDLIRYAIPSLIPEYYPLDQSLQSITESYTSNNLSQQLEHWINEKTFLKKRKYQKEMFTAFGKKQLQKAFLKNIASLFDFK